MNVNDIAYALIKALHKGSVHDIINTVYDTIGLPLVLSSSEYHVISQVPSNKIGDYVWDILDESRRPDKKSMEIFRDSNIMKRADESDEPFYIDSGYFSKMPRIITNVSVYGDIVGYLVVAITRKIDIDEMIEIMSLVRDTLSVHFERSGFMAKRIKSDVTIFHEKLISGTLTHQELAGLQKEIKRKLKPPFLILALKSKDSYNDLFFLRTTIKSTFPYLIPVIQKQVLYYLIDKDMMMSEPIMTQERLILYMNSLSAHVGVSEPFQNLRNILDFRRQAELAMSLAEAKRESVAVFRDQIFEILIQNIKRDFGVTFIHPVLKQLHEYDEENQTNLYQTLNTYSLSFSNNRIASEKLHIHRNTLLYRLGRIEEITQLDMNDSHEMLLIYLSFYIKTHDL